MPVVLDSRGSQAPVIKGEFDPDVATPKSEFHFFELQVDQLSTSWPEMKKRQRRWCTYSEAKHELLKLKRPELVDALNMSSILKDTIDDENLNKIIIRINSEKILKQKQKHTYTYRIY